MTVSLLAIGGVLLSMGVSTRLNEASSETTSAYAAAESTLERLRSTQFDELFARFNADPADDPDGAGTAAGADFAVVGLEPQPGDADGLAGRILFPVVDGAPGVLREDVDLIGRLIDLDVDGAIDGADKSGTYDVLPVEVRVDWIGDGEPRSVEIQTVIVRPL